MLYYSCKIVVKVDDEIFMCNVKFCANCSENKNSLMADISPQFEKFYAGFTVCFKQDSIKNDTKCPMCGKEGLIDSGITENDLNDIGLVSNYNRQLLESMIKLHNKDIIEYELKMTQFRTQYERQQSLKQTQVQQSDQSDNRPKCPTCGSTNIRKISATSKAIGAIGFGLFSKTARSQYECLDCKYKW